MIRQHQDPVKRAVAALTITAGFCALATLPACVEMDGPPLMHEVQQTSVCPVGTPRRKAVPKNIIDAFPTCCGGSGYLIPDYLIPKDFRTRLATGKGGTLCVPTEFAVNADYTPPRCTSVFGLKGACLSPCLPEIQNADIKLPRSTCTGGALCAPCVHPQTKKASGACDFGKMACDPPDTLDDCKVFPPTLDVTKYPSCCSNGRAHCAEAKLVPQDQRKDLNICTDGKSFCVPDDMLSRGGRYQPPTCRIFNGREGRCLSVCIKSVADQITTLEQSSCKKDERCVPCYDPRTGMGTGGCTVGPCDKAKEPPKKFEACGAGVTDAYCVPSYLIPSKDRCHFDKKGCRAGCKEPNTICVPKKVIDQGTGFEPRRCKASLSGFMAMFMTLFKNPFEAFGKMKTYSDGRCLSRCLPKVRNNPSTKMLSSKGCDATEVCIPCYDPMKLKQGKVPTGACHRTCN